MISHHEARFDLDQILAVCEALAPEMVAEASERGMVRGIEIVARRLVKSQMSAPKRGSNLFHLGVDTGTARRSIATRVDREGDVIRGMFGSPLGYVRAHEMGFSGRVQVREHVRRLRQRATSKRSARAMKRSIKGGRAAYSYVRAHRRRVDIKAKMFMWAALQGAKGDAYKAVEKEIVDAVRRAANA